MTIFVGDIDKMASETHNYREVLDTTKQSQLVIMNVPNGVDIGFEKHKGVTQTIKVVRGKGILFVGSDRIQIKKGVIMVIPPNTYHNVVSTSKGGLHLYSIYSPPVHPPNLIQSTKH